ncbi:MAG: sugar transferase [Acidimicrobiia bacterium]|nr:sugar transferase [Acidimicrobiia bacterium]
MLQGRIDGASVEEAAVEKGVEAVQPHLRVVPDLATRSPYQKLVKPVFDRMGGVVLSLATLPILLVVVPLIWWKLGRPAIFKQKRVGIDGREFTVYKLRTMKPDRRTNTIPFDGVDRRVNHKSPDDPRHVPLGRFLRKWSLDEIPQFWNVALGHMSLVGPRPELPHIVAKYEHWQHRRHEVKPGVTGLWQVSERGDVPMHEATDVDIEYVESVSLKADLRIMLLTVPAALGSNKGH